jgi:Kdo2-lipid IVA lauroyltransferase/acyltransferase
MVKKISHVLEYASLRLVQGLLFLLPRSISLSIGGFLGKCLYVTGVYRKIVRKNMEFVNIWPPDEQIVITKKLYRMMGRYATDFLRPRTPLPPHRIHDFELIQPLFDKGRGVIALLGHFGNWELMADIFGSKLRCLSVIAKPMRNRLVDEWLAKKRTAASVETIYSDQALRRTYEAIKANRVVAVLIDQNAGSHGTPAPFLGKETSTIRTVGGLVHKTGCAVLPVFALMNDDGTYEIVISVAPHPDTAGKSDDECIAAYQRQHNDILSGWVKQHPEHWFGWFHKRFRESIKYNEE